MAPIIIFLFFTLFSTTGGLQHHRRRLLHQPFFPVVPTSVSPSQQPSPSPSPQPFLHRQQIPKYPFSTTPPNIQQKPFFPSYHSPSRPPPHSVQSTFPANISSLLFPHPPSNSTHRRVIILAISLSLFSAAIITAVSAIFLYFRSRQRCQSNKTSVSDSQRLFPPNLPPSDGDCRTATAHGNGSSSNQQSTSSEFLYLGTLVNSLSPEIPPDTRNAGVKIGVSLTKSPSGYQKLGSPELKPLPPLPKHNPSYISGEMCFSKEEEDVKCETTEEEDEEDEEEEHFFSPRGSSGRKESRESPTPARIGSSSRRENFGSRSFNSRTASYPYSHSCSPANSITSSCHSPTRNLSPNFVKSRFPENVNNLSISSSSFSSRSDSGDTQNSPDRVSNSSGKNKQLPTRFVPIKLPPPPPPPPPPRFWEIPIVARRSSGPPVLVAPQNADVIRSLGRSLASGQLNKNKNVEKSEETLRPKLKPLHWDKVRASSDRAMVWDQLKSSSFQ